MEPFFPEIIGFFYLMRFDDTHRSPRSTGRLLAERQADTGASTRRTVCPSPDTSRRGRSYSKPPRSMTAALWNVMPYIVKRLCREKPPFAVDHLHLVRQELFRMLSWQDRGWSVVFPSASASSNINGFGRIFPRRFGTISAGPIAWTPLPAFESLFPCHRLFRESRLPGCRGFLLYPSVP